MVEGEYSRRAFLRLGATVAAAGIVGPRALAGQAAREEKSASPARNGNQSAMVTEVPLQRIRPVESDELLINPVMGFSTYQRFNGDPVEQESRWNDDGPTEYSEFTGRLANEGFPDTCVAYLRWYWMRLEPEERAYRWDIIDRALEQAGKRGQQLHIRVMPHDSTTKLPAWYVRRGKLIRYTARGVEHYIPDYTDPLFRRSTERLVANLGERYDGHPLLCAVDIGTLGFWGEWHNSGIPGNPMADEATRRWGVDLYLQAFKRTPLMMNMDAIDALEYATSKGTGWRADCWGDMRGGWCHMYDSYPRNLCLAKTADAWRHGPVCLETCWTFLYWFRMGWDIDYILDEALRWHTTLINAKSSVIPEPWRAKVGQFQKRLGYRFVLRSALYPETVKAGNPFVLRQFWLNRGVAPCYAAFRILLRLAGPGREIDVELPADLRTWMPGEDQYPEDVIRIPSDAPAGTYRLQMAIVRPGQKEPVVKMANQGRSPDGWLTVGTLRVAAP